VKELAPPKGCNEWGTVASREPPVVVLYPHLPEEGALEVERTLLHELLHIGLDILPEDEDIALGLEGKMWKWLPVRQKRILNTMLQEGGFDG